MNTHAKKKKKQQISTKKAKQRQNISTKKKLLNLIPIHWSNPLSSPYQALIQTLSKSFLTVIQWDVSKPRKKKSKTQSKPKLEKNKRNKAKKMNTHAKKIKKQKISTKKAKKILRSGFKIDKIAELGCSLQLSEPETANLSNSVQLPYFVKRTWAVSEIRVP